MKMQKIEVHIKNTEKWIKLIQEDLELINDKITIIIENITYLHGHYITPDIDESEITVFKGFVEEDIVKIIYIYEKNPFNINEVVMFDGKLENSELKGCTKLEKIEYIKEIPAPGILIFGTLYVLFLCMGWIKVTDFVLFMISFVIIIMIDRRSTLRRGTKKIKKYIQKFNRE